MKGLQSILQRLESFLVSINAPILDILRLGIDRGSITGLIAGLNLPFMEEVYELYAWRNGTKDTDKRLIGEMTLFTNGILYSLEESMDIYNYNAVENGHWDKKYFPLFSSGGGDFILVDLGADKSRGAILLYSPALLYSNVPVTVYDSLEKLFLSVLECYQQKAYYIEEGMLEKNIDLEFSICTKNNPHAKYWKDV